MKVIIGLALASGLAMLVAGCASTGGGGTAATSGGAAAAAPSAGAPTGAAAASSSGSIRNFNLAVKCPGIHWEKSHGWTDQKIIEQESVEPDDIGACEQWVANQPKGYVPPPPAGYMPKTAPVPAPSAGGTAH